MNPKPLALLFSTVWPEPDSSAAGVRQMQWVRFLKWAGYEVILSSPSKPKDELQYEVECLPIPLNRSEVRETLRKLAPSIVLFDRFLLEEQFGHFVYEECPLALVLLETEDLHFVRRAREKLRHELLNQKEIPKNFYKSDSALRETASIERVDFSFVVSSFEEKLLRDEFALGPDKVKWIPFLYEPVIYAESLNVSFLNRCDFSWIGNFRHGPNLDGIRWFLANIWPKIKISLPRARLHIYGAYPSAEVMNWSNEKLGIISHGKANTLDEVFQSVRVNLAPLRYGAGVKGKILEGFRHGIPCVSTQIGVEGLLPYEISGLKNQDLEFPGIEANRETDFADACVRLYENEALWNQKKSLAIKLMKEVYSADALHPMLLRQIEALQIRKNNGDLPRWTSKILRHELINSHKYFSKWIELKETLNKPVDQNH